MAQESIYFQVENLNGKHGLKKLKRGLDAIPGVKSVSVNEDIHRVAVDFDTTGVSCAGLEDRLGELGFSITRVAADGRKGVL